MTVEEAVLLVGLFGFIVTAVGYVVLITRRIAQLETKVEVLWRDVSFTSTLSAARILHREDDGYGLDALIDAFLCDALTVRQMDEFEARLSSLEESAPTEIERWCAQVLRSRIRARFELPLEVRA